MAILYMVGEQVESLLLSKNREGKISFTSRFLSITASLVKNPIYPFAPSG
jgi:hypothetical protein